MHDHPGWIQLLYKRHSAWHALHTAFLLNSTNDNIAEQVDALPNGREQLRRVALSELASDDPGVIALSLVYLGVVGIHDDLAAAESFLGHPSDLVVRAAKVCRYALRHAVRG